MSDPIQLQHGEETISILRRHPVYVVLRIIVAIVVAILLAWLLTWLRGFMGDGFLGSLTGWLIALVIIAGILYAVLQFYRYWNDLWMITNQRLIDSTRRNPFSHEVSSADLINVQDINTSKNGILATAFNFGDVRCQTASASTTGFIIRGVPKPSEVLELIDQKRDDARNRERTSAN